MRKILNIEYGAVHATYWMTYAIIGSFASAFLLGRGYSNSEIGVILAVGSVVAVFLQPVLADIADRSKKDISDRTYPDSDSRDDGIYGSQFYHAESDHSLVCGVRDAGGMGYGAAASVQLAGF